MSDRFPHRPGIRRVFSLPRSRDRIARDVDDELRAHLDQVAAELRAEGWSPADAELEAVRRFGDLNGTRAYCRAEDARRAQEHRRMTFIDELTQDLRYALRSLRASPGFAATALLTLALGIGANTAIFSVVRGVLLDALPFANPERIVRVWAVNRAEGIDRAAVSEPDFLDWRRESRLAQSMAGYFFADGLSGVDLTGNGNPERLSAALVTDGFFETLGVAPLLGRTLEPDNQVPGRNRVAVLSYGLWMRRFGGERSVVGSTIQLNAEPFIVAGVMPQDFTYPAPQTMDLWIPLSYFGPQSIGRARGARFLAVLARLKSGATEPQLRAELTGIAERLGKEYPEDAAWGEVATQNLRESILGEVRRPLVVLMVAVALLLLIACVNIASLLLARATGRRRELAVRAALGAGRGRIARQLVTESLTLAVLGGALGVGLAWFATRGLVLVGASELPRAGDIRIDGAVLGFTLLVTIVSGLLFGVAPTLRASGGGLDLLSTLRSGGRGTTGGARQRARAALVILEVALAVILVVGAGLATKSFGRLLSIDPGFEPSHALVAMMSVPNRYEGAPARRAYYMQVLEAIRRVPGVQAAGAIRDLPFRGNGELGSYALPGKPAPAGREPTVQFHQVSTDYFKALGTPLRSGRGFEVSDKEDAPFVVMVNEELARRAWPSERVEGKALQFGTLAAPVIGVVADIHQRGLAEPVEPTIYLHALQSFRTRMSIVIRTTGDPLSYAGAVRRAIWSVDPDQTITNMMTLESVLGSTVARPRLLAWLLALFGVMGLTLGALGIFGVLAYAVSQRRQEIGVRVAMGATPRAVMSLVVRQGMALAGIGLLVGLLGAGLLTRSMQSILYGIGASDPATFAQVVLVLAVAALLASWLPARRALRVDPVSALRAE